MILGLCFDEPLFSVTGLSFSRPSNSDTMMLQPRSVLESVGKSANACGLRERDQMKHDLHNSREGEDNPVGNVRS